ncbi:anaerobic ribonucleoside-triphosphate reductase activating protein [Patescibacteria group bacterium]|nr:anaerobic ribonucleoside-triphosphate reductase activating protein [Patescibacteria group bacterium]
MQIGGLQKLTLIDYPGKIACAVFLVGCNFRCPFCHNPKLVLQGKIKEQDCPPKFLQNKNLCRAKISEKDFFDFLKKKQNLIEGVVISGGEPTTEQGLPNFIEKIKKLGYLVKLDTNGTNPKMLKKIIEAKLIDYAAMDIKAPIGAKVQSAKCKVPYMAEPFNAEPSAYSLTDQPNKGFKPSGYRQNDKLKFKNKYERAAGGKVDLSKIKKSIKIIKKSGIDYEFRTTVVPTIHTKKDIAQIAKHISPSRRYYLQNFQSGKTLDPKYEKIKPFTEKQLNSMRKEANKYTFTELR